MSYTEHGIAKKSAEIAELSAGLVDHDLVLSKVVQRESVDQFKGVEGDQLTFRVPGRLPYRKYDFRNDRSNPIIEDIYKEARVHITWGGRIYSAVRLTDEQRDFDFGSEWEPALAAQTSAVSQGVQDDIANTIEGAPYEVTIGGAEQALRQSIVEARRVLGKFRVPNAGSRILVVGADFEAALLNDPRVTFANVAGDANAASALNDATLGRLSGFTVILDNTIPGDEAYAFASSAFVQYMGAPSIPQSIKHGATINIDGTTVRWLTDYDPRYMTDRSVVDTWVGSAVVKDKFLPKSVLTESADPVEFDPADLGEHFVRGVKLTLGGASVYPEGPEKADLIAETGISADDAWDASKYASAGGEGN